MVTWSQDLCVQETQIPNQTLCPVTNMWQYSVIGGYCKMFFLMSHGCSFDLESKKIYIVKCWVYVTRQVTSRRIGFSEFIAHSLLQSHHLQSHNYCHRQYHNYLSCSHYHALDATDFGGCYNSTRSLLSLCSNSLTSNWFNPHCSRRMLDCNWLVDFTIHTVSTNHTISILHVPDCHMFNSVVRQRCQELFTAS
jgi:hypothetical protein